MSVSTRPRLLRLLFSSGLQAVAIQLLSLLFFFLISSHLSKEAFGVISWCNAVAITITIVLSLGLEQVVIRRTAAGAAKSSFAAGIFLIHALASSIILGVAMIAVPLVFPESAKAAALPFFFAAQAFVFIATPIRSLLNGRQSFLPYALAALFANILKIVGAMWCVYVGLLSVRTVGYILIGTGVVECMCVWIYARSKEELKLRFSPKAYRTLIKEAAPLYLSVLFDAGLARLDWILLGLMVSSDAETAEYSLAYRAFELARLPLVAIGAILLPWVAKKTGNSGQLGSDESGRLRDAFTPLLFVGIGIAAVMNAVWVPVISAVTDGKYGASNELLFGILSICIPFQFAINFFWTVVFSEKRYKAISRITVLVALLNFLGCAVLIPLFGAIGAAHAFLLSTVIQAVLYYRIAKSLDLSAALQRVMGMVAIASILLVAPRALGWEWWWTTAVLCTLYPLLCVQIGGLRSNGFVRSLLPLRQ